MWFRIFLLNCLVFDLNYVLSVKLVTYISQHGLHGEIHFSQLTDTTINIESFLETTLQYPDQAWSWGVHQFPVDYTNPNPHERCELERLGEQIHNFDDTLGYLILPGNESSIWEDEMNLTGDKGLWGKSLVLSNPELRFRICATITTQADNVEHIAEAHFNSPIAGSMFFRWLTAKDSHHTDTIITSNLFHVQEPSRKYGNEPYTEHFWKIYVTDIFDMENDKTENNCNILQLVFDPQNKGKGRAIGDFDVRLGALKVSKNVQTTRIRQLFRDEQLVLLPTDLNGPTRKLYLVIFDPAYPDTFLGCAKIRHLKPRTVKSFINNDGVKGEVTLTQRSRFEPTWLNFTFASASNHPKDNQKYAENVAGFKIKDLPPAPVYANNKTRYCQSTGSVYNPLEIESNSIPPPGYGTQDQYPIGDLTGKLQNRNKNEKHSFFIPGASFELGGIYWDVFLPLEGANSVVHRGFSLMKLDRTDPEDITQINWGCNTLARYEKNQMYQMQMYTAQILFRYPIVGKILMRQPKEEPWEDTTVIFEYLIHADGSHQNNTKDHRWAINLEPPGKDFYDWQNRCISTGEVYNPYKVSFNQKAPEEKCTPGFKDLCRLGDMSNRLGTIAIAGSKENATRLSRKMFTDRHLPLSGIHKIVGKSVVIFDDHGPVARGERLACSIIGSYSRRKVVARDWYSNGVPLSVTGKLEVLQQSEYDLTNVEVDIKGLIKNSGYHVHVTPVEGALEFPCEGSSLYDHWNPRNVTARLSPPPGKGSSDRYEIGDLSGKYGTLEGYSSFEMAYNDTNLPLFGYESILGRSIVIHKKDKNLRWHCSTLERGYSPSEGREIRGIASFHNPNGYAYGYMRMTQLIGNDGSQSDTVIEIKLRHPGKNDRNVTYNHHWQIHVNPVGVDAATQGTGTRCVAGGYVWNPFYTQLADPLNTDLYSQECGSDNPLRCYVGDVSARVGTIDIGNKRTVVMDSNFPLEGIQSAMGRSIVIFGAQFAGFKYACANIEPDHDIIKYINIQKPPRFVLQQFLEDIRHVMGLPEWMLEIDSRQTKYLHNGACVQMIVHFKGPIAHRIEQEFSRLLSGVKLDRPTLSIPGYFSKNRKQTLSYRTCGVRDPNDKTLKKTFRFSNASQVHHSKLIVTLIFLLALVN